MTRMNKLSTAERVQIVAALVEGNSINSVVRMTGRSNNTILKLLADLGTVCQSFHNERVRGLTTKRVQCDEIWNFCYAKAKNVPADKRGQLGYGDVWTWVAIDADSKLIICWEIGKRDVSHAKSLMFDLADRVTDRIQITSDGYRPYVDAIYRAFGNDIDYAMLQKVFGPDKSGATAQGAGARYSPPVVLAVKQETVCGWPEQNHVSTSYVERSNLTMRMSMRRFTRLTNGFSKKLENLRHAVAINFVYYNFCRIHKTLRVTPAMEAGLANHVWELEELVALLD